MPFFNRVRKAWNAFVKTQDVGFTDIEYAGSASYGVSPSRGRLHIFNERSIIGSLYTRLSMDVSGLPIKHVRLDDNNRYLDDVDSALNDCLNFEANLDQGPRAFRQDIAMTLFDKGVAAIVPVDTNFNPDTNQIFDIYTLRVGEIVTWYPEHVRVSLYNEKKGVREEITLNKRYVAIIENPLYAVMNEPNSTLQRLIRKLTLLDSSDELAASGKLDLIIQLPYVIKSEARKQQAEQRRKDIEFQLKGSQYGIAYTDGTEKITQLNRAAENTLLKQVEYLVDLLYTQLGLTDEIMKGTADEATMINYYNRTIDPIMDAIVEAMQRSFLGSRVKSANERLMYFRDAFAFVPLASIADIADKFTRNEILTSNEVRHYIGIPPSKDPKADVLANKNMPEDKQLEAPPRRALTEVSGN